MTEPEPPRSTPLYCDLPRILLVHLPKGYQAELAHALAPLPVHAATLPDALHVLVALLPHVVVTSEGVGSLVLGSLTEIANTTVAEVVVDDGSELEPLLSRIAQALVEAERRRSGPPTRDDSLSRTLTRWADARKSRP